MKAWRFARSLDGLLAALMVTASVASSGAAQVPQSEPLIVRLVALAGAADRQSARRLADSILVHGATTGLVHAEALYWRGSLASPPAAGRADLLRLVIEYPLALRAADALYQLAQGDLAAGNRSGAIDRLSRVVREHPGSGRGAEAAIQLGNLLLEDGNLGAGCAALDSAMAHLAPELVERRNQVAYALRVCERTEASARSLAPATNPSITPPTVQPVARPATLPPRDTVETRLDTTPRNTGERPRMDVVERGARWSAQVAAFAMRADAERMEARLKARGYDVRVTDDRPYRVRIGRYAARADALALVNRLKAAGTAAILVEAERR